MTSPGTVLVVDDEAYVRDSIAAVLRRKNFVIRAVGSAAEALQPAMLNSLDAVITDLKMPGKNGLDLLRELGKREPALPVIVLTGNGSVPSAVECMKSGSFDYLMKPAKPGELVRLVESAVAWSSDRRRRSGNATPVSSPGPDSPGSIAGIGPVDDSTAGVSEGWRRVLEMVDLVAVAGTSVLVLGESGTGKEVVARLIHQKSSRSGGPFVAVNCAAVPDTLFESEFFGHRRGAFTGATADREGRFRIAHRGTLLLDEINSLSPAAQAKVLRVLQEGVFERVGDSSSTAVDVRLVCASNSDLEGEVRAGRFRSDLYYRVNVVTISIPPLRDRREDIPLLARRFLQELAGKMGKPITGIHPETNQALSGHDWPGNVRELRNIVERAVLIEQTSQLLPSSLPLSLFQKAPDGSPSRLHLRSNLAIAERRILEEALRQSGGVRREAARLLGIDERNLGYFLKKHDLGRNSEKGEDTGSRSKAPPTPVAG